MPQTAGKTSAGPALQMRLRVPAEGRLRGIAGELAAKIAEHLGTAAPAAESLASTVEGMAARVANAHCHQEVDFEFRQVDGELVIEARCNDRTTAIRHPL